MVSTVSCSAGRAPRPGARARFIATASRATGGWTSPRGGHSGSRALSASRGFSSIDTVRPAPGRCAGTALPQQRKRLKPRMPGLPVLIRREVRIFHHVDRSMISRRRMEQRLKVPFAIRDFRRCERVHSHILIEQHGYECPECFGGNRASPASAADDLGDPNWISRGGTGAFPATASLIRLRHRSAKPANRFSSSLGTSRAKLGDIGRQQVARRVEFSS